ncbi:unnamed protein product [Cuscuta europaea]|uniref:Ubiquitin-like protease family profile domain-containing protein n=1 Tax=Cuscuta europaea TaxID=41803 RepID=A0A9P0ZIY9_CUSEU|nr:unnamed protein product [Cuscuta europaea]
MEALDRLEKAAYLKFSMPSFDLGIEFSMTQPSQNEKKSTNENPVAQMTEDPIMKISRNIEEENNKEEMVEILEGGVREEEYRNQEDVVTEEQEDVEEEVKMTAPVAKRQKLKNASKAADTEWKFRSPYLKHNQRLCKEMRKEEKMVIDYAFSKEVGNELLYNDDSSLFLNHEEFQTLEDDKEVDNSVINAWVKLLNDREHKNNPPKRALILSTSVYAQFAVLYANKEDMMVERLEFEVDKQGNLKDYDMVLFPVHKSQHYYIYCFYTNKNIIDVIDNRILEDGLEFKDKYEESFNQLVEGFKKYCNKIKHPAGRMATWNPRILNMPWRYNGNYVDCGIFVMRHLETYRGQGDKWDSGFPSASKAAGIKAQKQTLKKLRLVYAAEIISSKFNMERENVYKRAKDFINM